MRWHKLVLTYGPWIFLPKKIFVHNLLDGSSFIVYLNSVHTVKV